MSGIIHKGDLDLGGLTSAKGLMLPEHVGGDLDLSGLTSAEGLELPEHVGGTLNLPSLTSAEGLELPEHVGGDLHLWMLDENGYDQKVHGPAELGGEVYFFVPYEQDGQKAAKIRPQRSLIGRTAHPYVREAPIPPPRSG